ncbi:MAG: SRPBCC family protein, partial [Gammaproteobacteria bacterium]|nr:SRPBCC family protein [Gammaproteobacteria bacterium]
PFHADAIWREIRDFNTYPNYIEGVTESVLEDDLGGDQVGCVRRFVYLGDVIRQTLIDHSDAERRFSHAGCEPLAWP